MIRPVLLSAAGLSALAATAAVAIGPGEDGGWVEPATAGGAFIVARDSAPTQRPEGSAPAQSRDDATPPAATAPALPANELARAPQTPTAEAPIPELDPPAGPARTAPTVGPATRTPGATKPGPQPLEDPLADSVPAKNLSPGRAPAGATDGAR